MMRIQRMLRVSATAALLLCAHAIADSGLKNVYVYNGGANNQGHANDVFTSGAQGWIFQQMGLLGPNGQPPTVNGNNLQNPAGDNVGTVVRDANNNIIAYQSADGKSRAYNIDTSATMADAWNAVNGDGTITIAKHGTEGGNNQGNGGGITLDGGQTYPGFRPTGTTGGGTGRPMRNDPYELPPRPDDDITMYINGCYTDHDPDGPEGPQRPVTDSAEDVPGCGTATGNDGVIYKGPGMSFTGPSQQAVDDAYAVLEQKAEDAGFKLDDGTGDVSSWVANMPFPDQYSAIADCLPEGVEVTISYGKTANASGGGSGGSVPVTFDYYLPVTMVDLNGALLRYEPRPGAFIEVDVPPGVIFTEPKPIFVHPEIIDIEIVQLQLRPAAWPVAIEEFRTPPSQPLFFDVPVFVHESFFPTDTPIVDVVHVSPFDPPQPVPFTVPQPGVVEFQVVETGVYVPVTVIPPPCPNDPGLACDTDLNGDCVVDNQDLGQLLASYLLSEGQAGFNPAADFNNDGVIDNIDLGEMLADYLNDCN